MMLRHVAMICLAIPLIAQETVPITPDVSVERAAMKKLDFLVGTWSGEARIFRPGAEPLVLAQTENVQYKLDGLLLVIEGTGVTKSDRKPALQAFGIISYDDKGKGYRLRAFNDGRWLESDINLTEDGKALEWGFEVNEIKTSSVLRVADNRDWIEEHTITVGSSPSRKLMDLHVRRTAAHQ